MFEFFRVRNIHVFSSRLTQHGHVYCVARWYEKRRKSRMGIGIRSTKFFTVFRGCLWGSEDVRGNTKLLTIV